MKTKYLQFGFLLTILLFLFSCKDQPLLRVVKESHPNGKEKSVQYFIDKNNEQILVTEEQFYESGQIMSKGDFKNNLRHGHWKFWYENGNLWSEGEFKNGKSHGLRSVYHENGQLYFEGKYKNGDPTGTWTFWDNEGRFMKEHKY